MEKIKVVIYDDPSEASFPLSFTCKNLKSKIKLLNFSRSPNLSAPTNSPTFRYHNRKSWILHNVYNGIFDHVIWMNPNKKLSHMKDRFTSNYFIGLDKNRLSTDIPDPYIYNSGDFSCSNHMRNRTNFKLSVMKIHEFFTSCPVCTEISSGLLSQQFALHIDLSLFNSSAFNNRGLDEISELNRIYRLYCPPIPPKIEIPLNSSPTRVIEYGLKLAQVINDERRSQLNQIEQMIQWLISADDIKWEETPSHRISSTNSSTALVIPVPEIYDIAILLKTYFPKYLSIVRRIEKLIKDCEKILDDSSSDQITVPQMTLTKKNSSQLISNPSSSPTITDADYFQSSETCLSIKDFSMRLHKCFSDVSNRYANIEHENMFDNPEYIVNCIESITNRFYNPCLVILSRQNPSLPEASPHHTLYHLSRQHQSKQQKNKLNQQHLYQASAAGPPQNAGDNNFESQPTIASSSNEEQALASNDSNDRLYIAQMNSIKMLSRIYGKKNLTFELNYPGCLEDAKKLQNLGYEAVGVNQPPINRLLSGTNSLSEFSFDWSIDDETEAELSTFEWSVSQQNKKDSSICRDNPNILVSNDATNLAALEPGRKEIL